MQSHRSKFKNKQPSIEQRIITGIGRGIWSLISLPFKKRKSGEVVEHWKEVQALMQKDDAHAWAMAIVKADSILDSVLQTRLGESSRGSTLGERLKNMENKLDRDTLQSAWDAHRVRNQIAHGESNISRIQVQTAIASFRKILNEFGEL